MGAEVTGEPAFKRLAEDLRAKIAAGTLPPGGQLPPMSRLRELHGVSSTVVRDALSELRREGLIVGQQGKGVFVSESVAPTASEPEQEDAIMQRLANVEKGLHDLEQRIADLEAGKHP